MRGRTIHPSTLIVFCAYVPIPLQLSLTPTFPTFLPPAEYVARSFDRFLTALPQMLRHGQDSLSVYNPPEGKKTNAFFASFIGLRRFFFPSSPVTTLRAKAQPRGGRADLRRPRPVALLAHARRPLPTRTCRRTCGHCNRPWGKQKAQRGCRGAGVRRLVPAAAAAATRCLAGEIALPRQRDLPAPFPPADSSAS